VKVAFHSRLLTERGSEGAMLDYARLNRSILGNDSVLCLPDQLKFAGNPILKKWQEEFPVIFYRSKQELGRRLAQEGVGILYMTKPGAWDGFLVPGVKNCIHAQFLSDEFHGDAYAYLSPWMARVMTGREESFVPFFVPRLESTTNLRDRLGIPREAKVFGRHGGWDTFNIPFVRREVARHAQGHPEDHFVFLNTKPIRGTQGLQNVHYLPATVDAGEKARFLATCDAMLHAQESGETFGLAIAEFAVLGKPVITLARPLTGSHAHLEMLRGKGLLYANQGDLERILREFTSREVRGTEYEEYADPKTVMKLFRRRFLD